MDRKKFGSIIRWIKMKIGIDEVGRGCLAGPVTVCAVFVPKRFRAPAELPELRDSKKMTSSQREAWCKWIKKNEVGICYAVSSVSPKMIDKLNISRAANLAAWRAFNKLMALSRSDEMNKARVTLDGGLFLKSRSFQEGCLILDGGGIIRAKTIIRADGDFMEVKIASVVAKVARDARMRRIGKILPAYGFEVHKGYGTKAHREAIKKSGRVEGLHRDSFKS